MPSGTRDAFSDISVSFSLVFPVLSYLRCRVTLKTGLMMNGEFLNQVAATFCITGSKYETYMSYL